MKITNLYLIGLSLFLSSNTFAQVNDGRDDSVRQSNQNNQVFTDYKNWDSNQDKSISNTEFYNGTYNHMDINRDQKLSKKEWKKGTKLYGDHIMKSDYQKFDADKNNSLTIDEYNQGISNSEFYTNYDSNKDGKIDEMEFKEYSKNIRRDGTMKKKNNDSGY